MYLKGNKIFTAELNTSCNEHIDWNYLPYHHVVEKLIKALKVDFGFTQHSI